MPELAINVNMAYQKHIYSDNGIVWMVHFSLITVHWMFIDTPDLGVFPCFRYRWNIMNINFVFSYKTVQFEYPVTLYSGSQFTIHEVIECLLCLN